MKKDFWIILLFLECLACEKTTRKDSCGSEEFLFEAEKQLGMKANSMKIEQAREILSKTKSRALRIDNLKEPLVQGLPKKVCASCNPMLHYFKIKEIH